MYPGYVQTRRPEPGVGYTLLRRSHQTVSGTCPLPGHLCQTDQVSRAAGVTQWCIAGSSLDNPHNALLPIGVAVQGARVPGWLCRVPGSGQVQGASILDMCARAAAAHKTQEPWAAEKQAAKLDWQ
jgi:hypothetical protein